MSPKWPPEDLSPSSARHKGSFAWQTVAKRWPGILTQVINDIHHNLCDGEKAAQGKALINAIQELKYNVAHDRPLVPLADDGLPGLSAFNERLAGLKQNDQESWFTGPWLYEECYMYRLLISLFRRQSLWRDVDPFGESKRMSFATSGKGVYELAVSLQRLFGDRRRGHEADDGDFLHASFLQLIQAELWGNVSDLSLFSSGQQLDEDSSSRTEQHIIDNDLSEAWSHLCSLKHARIDIVLDNAGFELFTDLVFADWLVSCTPYCSKVVFHPKLIPWFVSDVTPSGLPLRLLSNAAPDPDADFHHIFDQLERPNTFSCSPSVAQTVALSSVVKRWRAHLAEDRFVLADSATEWFWTGPCTFAEMPSEAKQLVDDLRHSGLVIFKGDLNYRKLTSDLHWRPDTPFETALGPLAGMISLLSLRTCKAEVAVGLEPGQAEELEEQDPEWRSNGKWGIIAFSKQTH